MNIIASEAEIKKRFRKLAKIYHPDKNRGSLKSEETFKVILNAYKVLSDKDKRIGYDIRYREYFRSFQSETNAESQPRETTERKYEKRQSYAQDNQQEHNQPKPTTETNINFGFWLILIITTMLYFYYSNKKATTGNLNADEQLEQQKPEGRPQSGELEFKK